MANGSHYRVAEVAEHLRAGHANEILLLPVRQGRVLILLPDHLLQREPRIWNNHLDHPPTRVDQTSPRCLHGHDTRPRRYIVALRHARF